MVHQTLLVFIQSSETHLSVEPHSISACAVLLCVDLQVFPLVFSVHSFFHPKPFSKRWALNHTCLAVLPPCSRTVYIFLFLSMSVALLKIPLVTIFVRVACARTFLNTDQEMGEFMSQSDV